MRTTSRAIVGVLALMFTLAGGCATVMRSGDQVVKLVTDPPEADLVVDGKSYVSPAEVKVKRNKPHDVTVSKAGYQGIQFKLQSHWDAGGPGAIVLDAALPGGSALFAIDTL